MEDQDKHQRRAVVLAGLVSQEDEQPSFTRRPLVPTSPWQRVIFATILIFVVLAPNFWQPSRFTFNSPGDLAGISALQTAVQSLPPEALVLVGVEYQPGYSGELDRIALPILSSMINRQARLVFVSTLLTGPLQAEHLLSNLSQSGGYPYQAPYEALNLGYLSGGRSGLQRLAAGGEAIFPDALRQSGPAETGNPIVHTPADFDMVWVISDSPDLARDWIEQIGPSLAETPLVMALSAQAAPLVQPYASRQVQVLVAGLSDGLAAASWLGGSPVENTTWASFNLAIVAVAALVVAFGLANALITHRAAARNHGQE